MIHSSRVRLEGGDWEVYLNDQTNELLIADEKGRCRHRSKGHLTTGMYLAVLLEQQGRDKFAGSTEALDQAMRQTTTKFLEVRG